MIIVVQGSCLIIAYLLDLILGDPQWLWHPVCGIGWVVARVERVLGKLFQLDSLKKTESIREDAGCYSEEAKLRNPRLELAAGILEVVMVLAVSMAATVLILWIGFKIFHGCYILLQIIICWQMLAAKSLKMESMKVYDKLKEKDLPGARKAVSMIVGRDTENLSEQGVIRATVETIAENTSDGVIAPMFYMIIGGAIGGIFYKTINTMDSMIGYKNDKYLYFGKVAAKLDDIVNFIPARIAAVCMIMAAFLVGLDGKGSFRIFKRDRFNHASPNSAQTEAVCSGALGVQLAGDAYYFGKLYPKKTIGNSTREINLEDIRTANRLMYKTALVMMFLILFCMAGIVLGVRK